MELKIKSRNYGVVTFSRPGSDYIFVDIGGGKPGTLGQQICDNGKLMGSTIGYSGDSFIIFENICRKWWRIFLNNKR